MGGRPARMLQSRDRHAVGGAFLSSAISILLRARGQMALNGWRSEALAGRDASDAVRSSPGVVAFSLASASAAILRGLSEHVRRVNGSLGVGPKGNAIDGGVGSYGRERVFLAARVAAHAIGNRRLLRRRSPAAGRWIVLADSGCFTPSARRSSLASSLRSLEPDPCDAPAAAGHRRHRRAGATRIPTAGDGRDSAGVLTWCACDIRDTGA